MACFIVPVAEAVVTTAATKVIKTSKSEKMSALAQKLNTLNGMLWGGSALLAFEHVWHGEVTPWFPFLTNALNPVDRAAMLYEMSTRGVAMALLVTGIWACMTVISTRMAKKPIPQPEKVREEQK